MDPQLAKEFSQNLDGTYTYLGTSMDKLVAAIQENSEATLESSKVQLKTKVDAADVMDLMKKESTVVNGAELNLDITNSAGWDADQKSTYLTYITKAFKESGMDISQLGIAGYSNDTDLSKLKPEDIDKIVKSLMEIEQNQEGNQKDLEKTLRSAMALSYKSQSASSNANAMGALRSKVVVDGKLDADFLTEYEARMEAIISNATEAGVDENLIAQYSALYENITELAPKNGEAVDATYQSWLDTSYKLADTIGRVEEAQKRVNEEAEKAKTSYDYLALVAESIEISTREVSKAERELTRKLDIGAASRVDVVENVIKQITEYTQQIQDISDEQDAIKNTLIDRFNNNAFAEYVGFDTTTGEIVVDWTQVNEAFGNNQAQMDAFDQFYEGIVSLRDTYYDNQETLKDIQDSVEELAKTGESEYASLWSQVRDGMITERQEQIDELTSINDTLGTVNQTIKDKMDEQIQEARQARENEKAQGDLLDKKAQLEALQRDSSGANAAQIAALQKELGQSEQSYQDSLIDQSLQKLDQSNQEAQQQRERQISLMEQQLSIWSSSPASWQEALAVLNQGLSSDNWLNTQMGALLQKTASYEQMNALEQQGWLIEQNGYIAMAQAYHDGTTANGESISGAVSNAQTALIESNSAGFGNNVDATTTLATAVNTGMAGIVTSLIGEEGGVSVKDALIGANGLQTSVQDTTNALTGAGGVKDSVTSVNNSLTGEDGVNDSIADVNASVSGVDVAISGAGGVTASVQSTTASVNTVNDSLTGSGEKTVLGGLGKNKDSIDDVKDEITSAFFDEGKGVLTDETQGMAALAQAQIDAKAELEKMNLTNQVVAVGDRKDQIMSTKMSKEEFMKDYGDASTAQLMTGGYSKGTNGKATEEEWKKYETEFRAERKEETLSKGYKLTADDFKGKSKDELLDTYGYATYADYEKDYNLRNPGSTANTTGVTNTEEQNKAIIEGAKALNNRRGGVTAFISASEDDARYADYRAAKKNYIKYGGDEAAFKTKVLEYLRTDAGKKLITGGSIDGVSVDGANNGGAWDTIGAWLDGTEYEAVYGGRSDTRAAPSTTQQGLIDSMMSGQSPKDGWLCMVEGQPFIYDSTYSGWSKFDYNKDSGTYDGSNALRNKYLSKLRAFETGGVADFTGPAWLDGTKSRPEYVLNAEQTQRFFNLVDVLDSLDSSSVSSSNGDNYFDINITVDSISDDYDVDQMAQRIKEIIYEDSMYRNVNAINQIR